MSKSTSKQKYQQLKEWLSSRGTSTTATTGKKPSRKFSKADAYNKPNRYGKRSN